MRTRSTENRKFNAGHAIAVSRSPKRLRRIKCPVVVVVLVDPVVRLPVVHRPRLLLSRQSVV